MEDVSLLEACRTCANFYINAAEVGFVHLFTPPETIKEEVAFILAELQTWQLQPQPDDGLPQRICPNCFATFCNVLSFRQDCVNAQERLMQAIMETQQTETQLCFTVQNNDELQVMLGDQLVSVPSDSIVLNTSDLENAHLLQNTTGLSAELSFIENMPNLLENNEQMAEEEQQVANNHKENNNDINSQNLNSSIEPASAEMSTNYDTINVCTTVPTNMDSMDLEDMLQSSIIPKKNHIETHETIKPKKVASPNIVKQIIENEVSDEELDDEPLAPRLSNLPYACQYCYCPDTGSIDHLVFSDCDTLSTHYFEVHDPDRPYNCATCTSIFQTGREREQHVRSCGFNTEEMLIKSPNRLEYLECLYCKQELAGSLDLHELNCCYEDNWSCNFCQQVFEKTPLYIFRNHQRSHNPNKPIKCRHCASSFTQPSSLAQHEKEHFCDEAVKTFSCEICSDSFTNEIILNAHKSTAHTKCNICNKSFTSVAFFQRHQEQFHPKQPDANSCNNCGQTFSSSMKLRNHLAKQRDENGQCIDQIQEPPPKRSRKSNMLTCRFCAKRFSAADQLEKHLLTHDADEQPLTCSECQVRCRNETELQEHINVAHVPQMKFNCKTCKQGFDNNKAYQTHLATHKVVVKMVCTEPDCSYVGLSKKALYLHKFHKHKLLRCPQCNEFFTEDKFKKHMSSEHGVHENGAKESDNTNDGFHTEQSEEHSSVPNGHGSTDYIPTNDTFFELPQMPTLAVDIQQNRLINNKEDKEPEALNMNELPVMLTTDETPDQYYFNIDTDHEIIIT